MNEQYPETRLTVTAITMFSLLCLAGLIFLFGVIVVWGITSVLDEA